MSRHRPSIIKPSHSLLGEKILEAAQGRRNTFEMGGGVKKVCAAPQWSSLSGVETLLFPRIPSHCPVITDPPLLRRNSFNLACIAVIYNEQCRIKFGRPISMFFVIQF